MPNHAKAIEAAAIAFAQARKDALGGLPKLPTPDEITVFTPYFAAAITAFLRTVDASPAMIDAYDVEQEAQCLVGIYGNAAWVAMSTTLANEVEQG